MFRGTMFEGILTPKFVLQGLGLAVLALVLAFGAPFCLVAFAEEADLDEPAQVEPHTGWQNVEAAGRRVFYPRAKKPCSRTSLCDSHLSGDDKIQLWSGALQAAGAYCGGKAVCNVPDQARGYYRFVAEQTKEWGD